MKNTLIVWSALFLIAGAILAIVGIVTMYNYEADSARIVGGDAYNFIIIATRGTGLICAGIVSALIGCALAVFSGTAPVAARRPEAPGWIARSED